jgi:protein-S-isoprenylcysteine O-methyltransferase Ste14
MVMRPSRFEGLQRSVGQNRLQKLFGIGPVGAAISLLLLALSAWADRMIGRPIFVVHAAPMKGLGIVLVILGLGLHFWSFWTLRHWWADDRLCTTGPFKYFRHPMYAAWITFVSTGVALYVNSWVYFLWALMLHPIWHRLVKKEETAMADAFGDRYREYARRTGRFIPRVFHRG